MTHMYASILKKVGISVKLHVDEPLHNFRGLCVVQRYRWHNQLEQFDACPICHAGPRCGPLRMSDLHP
eukprot:SAG31_NODE_21070_length_558_cov_1.237473_1_plen_67_part_10